MHPQVFMPGNRRLREAHALPDGNGAWPLIYDLERALLIEVPDEYQYHIQMVLETGELDDGLVGWLTGVDLWTYERWIEPAAAGAGWGSGGGEIGGVFVAGGAVHCHPGAAEPSAEVLAFPFETMAEAPVVFHLTVGPGGAAALRRAVLTAAEHAAAASRPLSFQLSGAAERLDDRLADGIAELAAGHRLRIRLSCPPAGADGRLRRGGARLGEGLAQLAEVLGPRLTVHARLGRRDRLGDLWRWAATVPLERLDAVKADQRPEAEHGSRSAEAQEFRSDLAVVCDEMFETLGQHRPRPLLYEPVRRIVRRLAAGAPTPADEGGFLALVRDGRLILCAPPLPPGARPVPRAEGVLPAGEPCTGCWARHLCAQSLYTRTAGAPPAEEPREDRCELWRDEVTAALFFYRRLQEVDSDGLLGLASAAARGPVAARETVWPTPPAPGPSWVF